MKLKELLLLLLGRAVPAALIPAASLNEASGSPRPGRLWSYRSFADTRTAGWVTPRRSKPSASAAPIRTSTNSPLLLIS